MKYATRAKRARKAAYVGKPRIANSGTKLVAHEHVMTTYKLRGVRYYRQRCATCPKTSKWMKRHIIPLFDGGRVIVTIPDQRSYEPAWKFPVPVSPKNFDENSAEFKETLANIEDLNETLSTEMSDALREQFYSEVERLMGFTVAKLKTMADGLDIAYKSKTHKDDLINAIAKALTAGKTPAI